MGVTAGLRILERGLSTTLQDAGRYGFLRYGVSPAGPCDSLLHAIANRLAGNEVATATLEFTLKGDKYKVEAESVRFAVAGDAAVEIDGQRVPCWRSYTLYNGQVISVGAVTEGVRGYVAVAGGFDLAPQLGSLSIHVRSGIGPLGGTAIDTDGFIPIKFDSAPQDSEQEFDSCILSDQPKELRVVLGPQDQYFSPEDITRFLDTPFLVTEKCDRMGYQLRGPKIDYRQDQPLISEGIALGSIQVPGDGLFIVSLLDRQTVGGYPKIATVISADIRRISQARPGTQFRFHAIDIVKAHEIGRAYAGLIRGLDAHLRSPDATINSEALHTKNLISGIWFDS
jgi:biotin-dependent carboxylase-like uncharacterized protein